MPRIHNDITETIGNTPLVRLNRTAAAHGAPLLPGTKVGVDYGPTLTTNWNNFPNNTPAALSKAVGTAI